MHRVGQRDTLTVSPALKSLLGQFDQPVGVTVNLRWGKELVENLALSLPLLAFGREDILTEGNPKILVFSERITITHKSLFEVIWMCEYVELADSKHLHPEEAAEFFGEVADECQRVTRELERLTEYGWPGCRWRFP
jgi:hypothetical protein